MNDSISLLRPGRLEVETDLLLGTEEVLLPKGFLAPATPNPASSTAIPAPAITAPRPSAVVASRGFDAALFEPGPIGATSRATSQSTAQSTAQSTPASSARRPEQFMEPKPAAVEAGTWTSQARTSGVTEGPTLPVAPQPAVQVVIEDRIMPPRAVDGATDKRSRLDALRALHAGDCPHCTRATGFTNLVFGEGNPEAEVVFVGEAPGETEDLTGRPFVGKAGEKLDEMIRAMGFAREDVYIANVLKARPPENRTPLAQEIERCGPYLLAQLAVIRPKAIVTLGGPATKLLLQTELGITRLRGVLHEVTLGRAEGQPFTVPVMPTFHPAYLLRNYTLEVRKQMWDDLKKVLAVLGRAPSTRESAATSGPT
jgi:uracil-DNA glycosylase family 4